MQAPTSKLEALTMLSESLKELTALQKDPNAVFTSDETAQVTAGTKMFEHAKQLFKNQQAGQQAEITLVANKNEKAIDAFLVSFTDVKKVKAHWATFEPNIRLVFKTVFTSTSATLKTDFAKIDQQITLWATTQRNTASTLKTTLNNDKKIKDKAPLTAKIVAAETLIGQLETNFKAKLATELANATTLLSKSANLVDADSKKNYSETLDFVDSTLSTETAPDKLQVLEDFRKKMLTVALDAPFRIADTTSLKKTTKTPQALPTGGNARCLLLDGQVTVAIDNTLTPNSNAQAIREQQALVAHEMQHLIQVREGRLIFKTNGSGFALFYNMDDEVEAFTVQFAIDDTHFVSVGITKTAQITGAEVAKQQPQYSNLLQRPAFTASTTLSDIYTRFLDTKNQDYLNFVQVVSQMGKQGETEQQIFASSVGNLTWSDFYKSLTPAQKTLLMIP